MTKHKMTKQQHRDKHESLHFSLDELLADWTVHTGMPFLDRPVGELVKWSFDQTKKSYGEEINENK